MATVYYVGDNIGNNQYKVYAHKDSESGELIATYNGYYDYRTGTFALYLNTPGINYMRWEVPGKVTVAVAETHRSYAHSGNSSRRNTTDKPGKKTVARKRPDAVPGQIKIE